MPTAKGSQTIRRARSGQPGLTYRVTLWEDGKEYRNDIDVKGDLRYIDICYNKSFALVGDTEFKAYQCISTHTSDEATGKTLTNTDLWTELNAFQPVLTGVLLAQQIKASAIDVGDLAADVGFINALTVKSLKTDSGKVTIENDGSITAESGTIENFVARRLHNPFTQYSSSTPPTVDNVCTDERSTAQESYELDWTAASSGRRLTIVGAIEITAPSGKYFYENGRHYGTFKSVFGCTEMLGYGYEDSFFGWIVLNRTRFASSYIDNINFGRELSPLAIGRVDDTEGGKPSFAVLKTADGSNNMEVKYGYSSSSSAAQGLYYLYCPKDWFAKVDDIYVEVTGYGASVGYASAPIKASVANIIIYGDNRYRIGIATSDDDSQNDGSFFFKLYNMAQWDDTY